MTILDKFSHRVQTSSLNILQRLPRPCNVFSEHLVQEAQPEAVAQIPEGEEKECLGHELEDNEEEWAIHRDGGACNIEAVTCNFHCQHHEELRQALQRQINQGKERVEGCYQRLPFEELESEHFPGGSGEALETLNFHNSVIARRYLVTMIFYPNPYPMWCEPEDGHFQYIRSLQWRRDALVDFVRERREKEGFDLSAYKSVERWVADLAEEHHLFDQPERDLPREGMEYGCDLKGVLAKIVERTHEHDPRQKKPQKPKPYVRTEEEWNEWIEKTNREYCLDISRDEEEAARQLEWAEESVDFVLDETPW
ncbi:hypothetical protein QC763_311197 [Podospora pseudopauciseta]|uniref:Uncharacterized protein n=1 Tax=Podospora pseudopauciseta TaxID=2093780 RepID=A0ABR0HIH0_9PEZI|nr:hypothetical protein QC763_311197 [Podospora pseudopauciseta]